MYLKTLQYIINIGVVVDFTNIRLRMLLLIYIYIYVQLKCIWRLDPKCTKNMDSLLFNKYWGSTLVLIIVPYIYIYHLIPGWGLDVYQIIYMKHKLGVNHMHVVF
jgi:hypothetical protein